MHLEPKRLEKSVQVKQEPVETLSYGRRPETEELVRVLGRILLPGDLFFIRGLGSGKTLLVPASPLDWQYGDGDHPALIHRYEELPFIIWLYRLSGPRI